MNPSKEPDSEVFSQVLSCTFSAEEYSIYSKTIFNKISENSSDYDEAFLLSIQEILSSKTYAPSSKFYALLLLVKTSETENDTLIKQLSNARDLLNILFLEAQTDRNKPLKEKGKHLFKVNSTEEEIIIGNNYMILLLEAFDYWFRAFGRANKKDPGHVFFVIFKNLSRSIMFPTVYTYVGENLQISGDFHLIPNKNQGTISPIKGQDRSELESTEAFTQLITCIASEEDYKAYSKIIFDTVSTEDKEYNKNLFLAFTEILGKTNFSFVLKFYALYLLVKLTETGNKTFITQFAQSTKLLNQIYKLAKDSGTLTGPTILPSLGPNDSEIQHRNKFNVLILEAVKYWHLTYGDPDPSRTAHNFTNMVDALGKWVLLPEEFTYIQTQAQAQAQGNEGESLEILENNNVGLLRQQNQPESYDQEAQGFLLNKMQNCISSGLTFRDNYRTFAEELLLDLTQGDRYLQETLEILSSTEYTPSSKFYTLYLLVKVTELAENDFMVMLAKTQKLMSKFFEDAQFDKHKVPEQKGMTFFGRRIETNNGIIASNYLQLLSEAIHFWGQVFSVDDRKDNRHVFKLMSEQLMKMTKVEPQQYYIGRDLDQLETQLMARFELTPFKSLPLTQEKELESIQNGEILEESIKTKAEPVTIKGEDNRHKIKHKDPETIKRDMEIRLEKLRESKRKLREFLKEEKQENQATRNNLDHFYQQVLRNYHDDVIKLGGSLLITHHKDKNDLLEAFHKEGEVTEQLQKDYSDYTTKKITYSELRRRMLLLLSNGKESPEKSLSEPKSSKSSKSTKSLKKHKKKEGQPKVRVQKFYACDMLDDEDSPRSIQSRISSSQSKCLEAAAANKENPILSPTSPLLKEEALLGGYFSKPSLQTVPKVLELRDSKEFNKEKIKLEIREHQTPEYLSKSPMHRNSLDATPKNFETDLEKLEQNIRMSKSKIDSLADMEESIKHSFKAQGREPPGFKSVVNMEYTSALQEEIVKLKKEREDLLRENEVLKSRTETVVNIDLEERETSQIEDMKSLLSDYQKKIDNIQQQLEESSSPRRKLSRQSPELQIGHLQNSVSLNNINIKSGHITPSSHLESVITPKNKSEVDPQFKTSILDHFLYSSSYVRQSVDLETQRRDFNNREKPKSSLGNSQSHHILRSSNYLMKAEPIGTRKVESQSQATRKSSLNVIEDQRNNKDHYQSTFLDNNSLARSQALLSRNSLAKSLIYTNERNLGGSAAIYTELDKFVSPKAKVWNEGLKYTSKDRVETVVFESHRDRDGQRSSFFDNSSGNGNGRSDHNNLRKSYKPPEYRSNLLAGLKLRILDMSSAQNAMFNYKLSCLRRSGILYEDKNLRIEASTNIIDDQYDPESVLIINLHYSNKGYDKLSNLRVDFPEISKANIESQPKIEYVLLQPGQEVSQQVFFSFKEWPLQVPQLFGNYKTARFREDFSLFLPTLITNFMNFRAMDVVSFEREFKLAENVVDSDEIEIDHFIVQNPIDFQKYFPGLMDLNMLKRPEMVGVHDREITFGGVFRINWTPKDYFLKIRVFDINRVIFSIATKEESCNFVDIVLETLGFLFGRD